MVCPSRKNLMICKIVQDKRTRKIKKKIKEKKITEKEHKNRLEKLKEMGIFMKKILKKNIKHFAY